MVFDEGGCEVVSLPHTGLLLDFDEAGGDAFGYFVGCD